LRRIDVSAQSPAVRASTPESPGERSELRVEGLSVFAATFPTEEPESDGTLEWDSTTMVLVQASAGGESGIGWSYTDAAAARLVAERLRKVVSGAGALAPQAAWELMVRATRNLGEGSLVAHAISAVDGALWDLAARLLGVSLLDLLGCWRESVPVYGSGGFTSLTVRQLERQLAGWVGEGIPRVKMKVGRDPAADPARVAAARRAIGADAELMVDGNGAYTRQQALALAQRFADEGVTWFEEPLPSADVEGLAWLRAHVPAGMEIAGGEYGWDLYYFERMLDAGAVDVLQPDATRCGGITGLLQAGVLCRARRVPLSAHTAPNLHAHPCCAIVPVRHVEWFHDHVRIERLAFDGALEPRAGELRPDRSRPGNGLAVKWRDLEPHVVFRSEALK
jgi:L-alanine-DL-glutamate epimerase-like enolase superfamily enzyme